MKKIITVVTILISLISCEKEEIKPNVPTTPPVVIKEDRIVIFNKHCGDSEILQFGIQINDGEIVLFSPNSTDTIYCKEKDILHLSTTINTLAESGGGMIVSVHYKEQPNIILIEHITSYGWEYNLYIH